MEVNHPVGVPAVALAARQILDLGRIRKGQLKLTLQSPPHALPVTSRGFHHHVPHLVASQPGRQLRELARGRTVGATLASNAACILNPNGRRENVLPKVQSCAARIDHMHTNTLRALARDPICGLPKTGKRARGSRCRLLPKNADTLRAGVQPSAPVRRGTTHWCSTDPRPYSFTGSQAPLSVRPLSHCHAAILPRFIPTGGRERAHALLVLERGAAFASEPRSSARADRSVARPTEPRVVERPRP